MSPFTRALLILCIEAKADWTVRDGGGDGIGEMERNVISYGPRWL